MQDRNDDLPMGHDGYLKLWALNGPRLNAEYVLLDEAQDTNQVVLGVLQRQNSQIVYVGDRHQQIYEWRGAVNAMEQVAGCDETSLTQSFRFGEPIAEAASRVLGTLGETQRLRGNPKVQSSIVDALTPTRAVLARTNANVIVEVLDAVRAGRKPCIVGGTGELTRLLSDVYELKDEKPASSPEFFGFASWREVVAFADSEEGESIRSFVQLVEQHGENKLWPAVKGAHDDENSADVVLSTAHKAKGREWDSVRLAADFASSHTNADQADNEAEVGPVLCGDDPHEKTPRRRPALLTQFTTEARVPRH
jgi:superfamily I DNA/RNA helicase